MERNCKNCRSLVYAGKSYCADCGAKWIEKRITMRNVGADVADMYLGIDTKFGRNFIDLFTKPHHVINGYIKGARMNYVDAIRYVFIAIFMSGIYMFVVKTFNIDITAGLANNDEFYRSLGYTEERIAETNVMNGKVFDFVTKYQGLIIFMTLPILAFIGRITFWKNKKYNFTEHLVFHMYTYSHFVIVTTPISILLSFINVDILMAWSMMAYPMLFIYNTYCYKKCMYLNWQEAILKALIAILISVALAITSFLAGIIITIIVVVIYKKYVNPA
ncbi:MAG: DUF3667 domain-containing protein [Nonlabens ulvanivorans]|uniref:Uncharacterized protein DUF3667 n=1 Tax=Nonlabens ulvanivorans TaxID=906888 RepID=A0A081DDK9_NONUL|nr:DUF3667 domain-containing protein [Nonlabens ulvanivorans]KEZ93937.1 hypothetical protein IL45_07015 [Nonlabens ulvanivorans]PRX14553.1 uncharacterized protein DUF3667 [Nonlabens ulvanivorans]GAK77005.1 hypothetical protein JCM19296_2609 [Nonlabens ulvanivorans]